MAELHVEELPDSKLLTRINKEFCFGGNLNLSARRRREERPNSPLDKISAFFANLFSLDLHGLAQKESKEYSPRMKEMA
jgi:hypothetical protein